eukprot:scaffold653663_cov57-Prasinocladus_malaysianus.AAC.1
MRVWYRCSVKCGNAHERGCLCEYVRHGPQALKLCTDSHVWGPGYLCRGRDGMACPLGQRLPGNPSERTRFTPLT